MRSLPRLLAALLLVAAALSGCLGDEADPAPADATDATSSTGGANATLDNVTVDDGTMEMDADAGHLPHVHDYWKDRERVTLMDDDVNVDAPTALFWTFFDVFRGTPGVGGAIVRLPDGQIVYEGTGKLEFTATWSEATVTGMGMSYRSPADSQFGAPQKVSSGQAIVVDVTPEMTDMPHAKTSRWQFLLMPAEQGQTIVGKFHVKIDILRVGDIGVFPGHPALFGGEHTLELFNGAGKSTQDMFVTDIAEFMQGQSDDDGVPSEKVVPMETQSMTGNLTLKSVTGSQGAPSNVYLLVKSADRNGYRLAQAYLADESKQLYQFAWLVKMQETDSPYASESDWKFDVFVTTDQNGDLPGEFSWASAMQVDYELVVVAYDDVVPDAGELRNMGRGG